MLQEIVQKIPFKAIKVRSPKCVWLGKGDGRDKEGDSLTHRRIEELAYIVQPNEFFNEIETVNSQVYFEAEYYGGIGIGENGGGGRCGQFSGYQLKGIGRTPVLGQHNNLYCSSGMLPLYEAVVEAVNTEIFNKFFPLGMVRCLGIIYIGDSPSFVTAENSGTAQPGVTPLAISVREKCERVGHLVRAYGFKPRSESIERAYSDVVRVRKANKRLKELFNSTEDYLQFFGGFLDKSAKQVAFGFVNRVAHGALTPSNIALDGRWLDLTNMTCVPSGFNYKAGSGENTFLDESEAIIIYAQEMLLTYGKYNDIQLSPGPLIKFYKERYNEYCLEYLPNILGLKLDSKFNAKLKAERSTLLNAYKKVLCFSPKAHKGVPRASVNSGSMVEFIESLLRSAMEKENVVLDETLRSSVSLLFRESYRESKHRFRCYNSFIVHSVISALRQVYYTPFFYLGRIYKSSKEIVAKQRIEISDFIESYGYISDWVFRLRSVDGECVIFSFNGLILSYSGQSDCFFSTLPDKNERTKYSNSRDLANYILTVDRNKFVVYDYDFLPEILRILKFLDVCNYSKNLMSS